MPAADYSSDAESPPHLEQEKKMLCRLGSWYETSYDNRDWSTTRRPDWREKEKAVRGLRSVRCASKIARLNGLSR